MAVCRNAETVALAAIEAIGLPPGTKVSSFSINVEASGPSTMSLEIVLTDSDVSRIMEKINSKGISPPVSITGTPSEIHDIASELMASIKKAPAGAVVV